MARLGRIDLIEDVAEEETGSVLETERENSPPQDEVVEGSEWVKNPFWEGLVSQER